MGESCLFEWFSENFAYRFNTISLYYLIFNDHFTPCSNFLTKSGQWFAWFNICSNWLRVEVKSSQISNLLIQLITYHKLHKRSTWVIVQTSFVSIRWPFSIEVAIFKQIPYFWVCWSLPHSTPTISHPVSENDWKPQTLSYCSHTFNVKPSN